MSLEWFVYVANLALALFCPYIGDGPFGIYIYIFCKTHYVMHPPNRCMYISLRTCVRAKKKRAEHEENVAKKSYSIVLSLTWIHFSYGAHLKACGYICFHISPTKYHPVHTAYSIFALNNYRRKKRKEFTWILCVQLVNEFFLFSVS